MSLDNPGKLNDTPHVLRPLVAGKDKNIDQLTHIHTLPKSAMQDGKIYPKSSVFRNLSLFSDGKASNDSLRFGLSGSQFGFSSCVIWVWYNYYINIFFWANHKNIMVIAFMELWKISRKVILTKTWSDGNWFKTNNVRVCHYISPRLLRSDGRCYE